MVIVGMPGAAPSHSYVNPKDQTTSLQCPSHRTPARVFGPETSTFKQSLTVLAPVWAVTVVGPMVT
jgi:hypothetical protein